MENIINKKKENIRGAGVLLAISSLPSPYGIGSFGKEAYEFVDCLEKAGQRYWQVLPMGPISYGDSPYQSLSAFAGNPYYIDIDKLSEERLLSEQRAANLDFGDTPQYVQYDKIYSERFQVLRLSYSNWKKRIAEAVSDHCFTIMDTCIDFYMDTENLNTKTEENDVTQYGNGVDYRKEYSSFLDFCDTESDWLEDYALYMACKIYFGEKEWSLWDEGIRIRLPEEIEKYKKELSDDILYWKYLQFKFFMQWEALKEYAHCKGVKIIGDIPLYVAYDSADVWSAPQLYRLNEDLKQTEVAGCPPDCFSADGQKWGNPIYNWEAHKEDGFAWWKKRMLACVRLYDITRIDHFIGIVRYYCIPYDKTAAFGWYEKGPGYPLVQAINEVIKDAGVIAEDLGVTGPDVEELLVKSGYPGMKELEVAFNSGAQNDHLPHFHKKHGVVYIGTHDNETLKGHLNHIENYELEYMMNYIGALEKDQIIRKMIRTLYMSVADVVVLQMQDILEKDNSARMNFPSTLGDNWKWRLTAGEFTDSLCYELRELAETYGRLS